LAVLNIVAGFAEAELEVVEVLADADVLVEPEVVVLVLEELQAARTTRAPIVTAAAVTQREKPWDLGLPIISASFSPGPGSAGQAFHLFTYRRPRGIADAS
jgi:hypothetical protein